MSQRALRAGDKRIDSIWGIGKEEVQNIDGIERTLDGNDRPPSRKEENSTPANFSAFDLQLGRRGE